MQARHVTATCHCGAVELSVDFPEGFPEPINCDCSICKRRGVEVLPTALENVRVTKGADMLTLYQFNTFTAKHYFCSVCGIYTHHQRRANPEQFSINTGCIDNL